MPVYEFVCLNCGKDFEIEVDADKKNDVKCIECGSASLRPKFGFLSFLRSCGLDGRTPFG